MKSYFTKFAWKNTTLEDFTKNLKEFVQDHDPNSPYSVESWENDWLLVAGLTQINVDWNPDDKNPNAKLTITQSPCQAQFKSNKYIKVKVGFLDEKGQVLEVKDVILNKDKTEVTYDGSKHPKIIFPNYGDHGYVKVNIDAHSLIHLQKSVHLIQDDATRATIWYCFYKMTPEDLNPLDFVEAVCNGLEKEKSDLGVEILLEYLAHVVQLFVPLKLRNLVRCKIFEKLYRITISTDLNQINRILLLRTDLINFAKDDDHLDILKQWLEGTEPNLKDHKLRKNDKWHIVRNLYKSERISLEEKEKIYQTVYQQDPSDSARRAKMYCDGVVAHEKGIQKELWEEFFNENTKKTYPHLGEYMSGFACERNISRVAKYDALFYEKVFEVFNKREMKYARQFMTHLWPSTDDIDYQLKMVAEFKKMTPKCEEGWRKALILKENSLTNRKAGYEKVISSFMI
jgi:hypothetical protein